MFYPFWPKRYKCLSANPPTTNGCPSSWLKLAQYCLIRQWIRFCRSFLQKGTPQYFGVFLSFYRRFSLRKQCLNTLTCRLSHWFLGDSMRTLKIGRRKLDILRGCSALWLLLFSRRFCRLFLFRCRSFWRRFRLLFAISIPLLYCFVWLRILIIQPAKRRK